MVNCCWNLRVYELVVLFFLLTLATITDGQTIEEGIQVKFEERKRIKLQLDAIDLEIQNLRLEKCIKDLKSIGLPSADYVEHSAMILSYSEEHEQAAWVSHMILPQIVDGKVHRTNDFRIDPKIKTGTAVEEDYFLKFMDENGEYEYDGYGYDRGHLAPSADFRWSKLALSESYYYSNMSPQLPEFNREIWSNLESTLRAYVLSNQVPLYVVTLPILFSNLAKMERSTNSLSIPNQFAKVVLDLTNNRSIAFLMNNEKATDLLPAYAVSVDEVEYLTGFDFFKNLDDKTVEANFDKEVWFPELGLGDKEPIYQPDLPKGHFNSKVAAHKARSGKQVTVCGHVVATRYSRSGNLWLNLDKQFPNQIFSVYIKKDHLHNFSNQIEKHVKNKDFCFTGKVDLLNDVPTMKIEKESKIKPILIDRKLD